MLVLFYLLRDGLVTGAMMVLGVILLGILLILFETILRGRAIVGDEVPVHMKLTNRSLIVRCLIESWSSSVQRAPMVSRIFMAAFVWMSLFFGISVANNEVSGGRPGRRGPRK